MRYMMRMKHRITIIVLKMVAIAIVFMLFVLVTIFNIAAENYGAGLLGLVLVIVFSIIFGHYKDQYSAIDDNDESILDKYFQDKAFVD